jgi:hypothetical protein
MSHNSAKVTDVFSYALQFGIQKNFCFGRDISFCQERFGIHMDVLLDYSETVHAKASY